MEIMDCTLRDGANVVGTGFSADETGKILAGLIRAKISIIEIGHPTGIGTMKKGGKAAPVTDEGYLDAAQPYTAQAQIGMFMLARNADEERIALAAERGLRFLRIGANAGDGAAAEHAVKLVRKAGLEAKYSLMKAYVLSPEELASEGAALEGSGVQALTIMDSAGFMTPEQTALYTEKLVASCTIPIGFHGHSNLGMAQANALAAVQAGASFIDAGLMGMARSAGNIATEGIIAALQRRGEATQYDLYALLRFIDTELIPMMQRYDYRPAVPPLDLVLGLTGCHSNFLPLFRAVADEYHVDLYRLIAAVSAVDQKNPTRTLLISAAEQLAAQQERST